MSDWEESLIWEGSEDTKREPGQFPCKIEMQIDRDGLTFNKQMVNHFKVNLKYGFEADLWFNSLKLTEKDTYSHLEVTFKVQYPSSPNPSCQRQSVYEH